MRVTVSTPSRLHFGLLRFEQRDGPSYGGLGMMVREPRWEVELEPSVEWAATGPSAERALEYARRGLRNLEGIGQQLAANVVVRRAAPEHCGLGGGTQLGLAVAAAVRRLSGLDRGTAGELAALVGRGQRSAVGSHGFLQGGLVWELGRLPCESLGRLADRVSVPEQWRVLLVAPRGESGLSGRPELDAFRRLPAVPREVTERLVHVAEEEIIPAIEESRLAAFSDAVYEYGRLAGNCFASVQGGPYASPRIAECVALIRDFGVRGAGQSSWGPTVFAFVEDQVQAEWLVAHLRRSMSPDDYDITMTAADNVGAVIETID